MLKSHFSYFKILNVVLRVAGVGSKFIVLAVLSKSFSKEDFGNYSLIVSLITFMIFVLGADFYNFSIRNILRTNTLIETGNKILSSVFFYILIYIVFIAISFYLFRQIDFTREHIYPVIILCITEHFSQECYRLLIGFNKVLMANMLLFIRTAGWSIIVLIMLLLQQDVTIEIVLRFWLTANLLAIAYLLVYIVAKKSSLLIRLKPSLAWVKKGLAVCYVFFVSTIFLKIIEYANRFIVNYYLGEELAGIFTFFSSISILISLYINTIVVSFEMPPLIKATKNFEIYRLLKKFKKSLFIQIIVIVAIIFVLIKPLLIWQNKPEFSEYLPILFFLIIGVSSMNYSLVYHFKLYVKHHDYSIAWILVYAGVFSLIVAFIFTKHFGLYGTSIAFMLSSFLLHYLRFLKAKKIYL